MRPNDAAIVIPQIISFAWKSVVNRHDVHGKGRTSRAAALTDTFGGPAAKKARTQQDAATTSSPSSRKKPSVSMSLERFVSYIATRSADLEPAAFVIAVHLMERSLLAEALCTTDASRQDWRVVPSLNDWRNYLVFLSLAHKYLADLSFSTKFFFPFASFGSASVPAPSSQQLKEGLRLR